MSMSVSYVSFNFFPQLILFETTNIRWVKFAVNAS